LPVEGTSTGNTRNPTACPKRQIRGLDIGVLMPLAAHHRG